MKGNIYNIPPRQWLWVVQFSTGESADLLTYFSLQWLIESLP